MFPVIVKSTMFQPGNKNRSKKPDCGNFQSRWTYYGASSPKLYRGIHPYHLSTKLMFNVVFSRSFYILLHSYLLCVRHPLEFCSATFVYGSYLFIPKGHFLGRIVLTAYFSRRVFCGTDTITAFFIKNYFFILMPVSFDTLYTNMSTLLCKFCRVSVKSFIYLPNFKQS